MLSKEEEKSTTTHPLLRFHYTNPILIILSTSTILFSGNKIYKLLGRRIKNSDYLVGNWVGSNGVKTIRGVCTRLAHIRLDY